MSEHGKDSPHGRGPYGSRGQKDLLGESLPGSRNRPSAQSGRGFFDEIQVPVVRITQVKPETVLPPDVKEYFKKSEIPDSVFVPPGVAYYEKFEDIPIKDFRNRSGPPKIDSIEERASVVLNISPSLEGEEEFSSFRFVGERGLYVRVIKEYEQKTHNDLVIRTPVLRWVPYNSDEDVLARKIRRV